MRSKRRVFWVVCCAACLFIPLLKPDGGIFFVAPLILLTFPAGFLGDRALGFFYTHFGIHAGGGTSTSTLSYWTDIGLEWLVLFSCGYVQWFVFLPWIARRWDRLAAK